MIEIAWGIRVEDGRVVGVDQVPSGLECGCICYECRRPLVAAKGDINQHHFRHQADPLSPCGGGQETAMHQLAKTIVAGARELAFPDRVWPIISSRVEPWLDGVRPDVLVETVNGSAAIEIAVNHRCSPDKIQKFLDRGLEAVEIDLGIYRGIVMSEVELREKVLLEARRYWLQVKITDSKVARPRPQPPSLQALVEKFTIRDTDGTILEGGFPRITEDAWAWFYSDMQAWKLAQLEGVYYKNVLRTDVCTK